MGPENTVRRGGDNPLLPWVLHQGHRHSVADGSGPVTALESVAAERSRSPPTLKADEAG